MEQHGRILPFLSLDMYFLYSVSIVSYISCIMQPDWPRFI